MSVEAFSAHVKHCADAAATTGQRPLLWLMGECGLAFENIAAVLAELTDCRCAVWVSKAFNKLDEGVARELLAYDIEVLQHPSHLLGTQTDVLIYDAHQGFDPDLFCLAAGTLKAGGVLLFLSPTVTQWLASGDPDYQRMLVYPHTIAQIEGRFLQRWIKALESADGTMAWDLNTQRSVKVLGKALPQSMPALHNGHGLLEDFDYTHDQKQLIAQILRVAEGHRNRPLVVTADRGRGKSAAIGAAVARLIQLKADVRVAVTAPNQNNCQVLFNHCKAALSAFDLKQSSNALEFNNAQVRYIPPDELIRLAESSRDTAYGFDLLIVEEAAAIPEFCLRRLLHIFHRIVFATTVHGYEGTGRGFQIRFQPYLDEYFQGWRLMKLSEPIRWGKNDLLEGLMNDAFLLNTEFASPNLNSIEELAPDHLTLTGISQAQLAEDQVLLAQVFGLLVQAHYRTSPGDLRDLLDGVNLTTWLLTAQGQVVGCALVAEEGDLDEAIVDAVYSGKRRPKGHLLPQTICQCLGEKAFARYQCARIVRIAITPELQRLGLGSRLLERLEQTYAEKGFAFIGSSFAAHPRVISFWHANHYHPIRLGFSKETSSGAHSLLVMKALSQKRLAATKQFQTMVDELYQRFSNEFLFLLGNEFQSLSVDEVLPLMATLNGEPDNSVSPNDYEQVRQFARGARTLENVRFSLWKFVVARVLDQQFFSVEKTNQRLILDIILRQRKISDIRMDGLVTGKKQAIKKIRDALATLLPLD